MITRVPNYKDLIAHLPAASVLVLENVSWEEYESLLDNTADGRPGVRVTYDQGRLEIVTTSRKHEKYKELIARLIYLTAEEFHLSVESSGGTTWKRKPKGTEADTCFHIANAGRVIGKDELNLEKDPPPDLAVEIDVSNQSLSKFPIYAAFGIPEIWRYIAAKTSLHIYELRDGAYTETEASRSFPILTSQLLTDFLERSSRQGQTQSLSDFRIWLRQKIASSDSAQ